VKLRVLMAIGLGCMLIVSCGPVKMPVTHTYTLSLAPEKHARKRAMPYTLLISKPGAAAGYKTTEMYYLKKPYMLEPFAKNAWESPPPNMLYPILVKRFQDSRAFRAVSSSPYADKTDYRLDTQLLELYQNFMTNPSHLKFKAKVAVTRVRDNHVMASRMITVDIPCSQNNPYGGVTAANQAVARFVEETLDFVIKEVQSERGGSHS